MITPENLRDAIGDLDEEMVCRAKRVGPVHRNRVKMGLLIAAAVLVVGCVTAGGVGYTIYDRARMDLGISSQAEIPEYTEYTTKNEITTYYVNQDNENYVSENAGDVTVISTFCAGNTMTAYLSVSDVTQELVEQMEEELGAWELGHFLSDGDLGEGNNGCGLDFVSYDPETQNVLLKIYGSGQWIEEGHWIEIGLCYYDYTATTSYGEGVMVPVEIYYPIIAFEKTESETMTLEVAIPVENADYPGEVGTVTKLNLCAGAFIAELKFPSLLTHWDGLAGERETPAYFQSLDGYLTSWCERSAEVLLEKHIVFHMKDGTTVALAELERLSWDLMDFSEDSATLEYAFATPLEMARVESIEFVQG